MKDSALGPAGQEFHDKTLAVFGMSDSELLLLTQACKTLDALADLDAAVITCGTMVEGSKGQPVLNPAVAEARSQRMVLRSLLVALAIPDTDGKTVSIARRTKAAAAATRWSPARRAN